MNYEGEKFLLKLYRELYKEESVKHSGTKSDDKFELVKKYLKRLENTEKAFDRENETAANYLKNRYYDKYVIKKEDIPESYYELKEKIALERGFGHVKYTEDMKHKEAKQIIQDQKDSLDNWINYLMKENTSYPMWARYWAFQGMLKLGKYNKEKGSFAKRSKGTTAPFIELNAEALALTMETVVSYQQGNEVNDEKLENLVKSGNFGKIYAYNIWKIIENEKKNLDNKVDTTEGIWKEYREGSHEEIVHDIENKETGWCIAGKQVAKEYSDKGKLYIYYTKDKNNNYTIPRICIREEYGKIAEVRGISSDQNIEPEMVEIVDKKLDEFPDKEEYKKKVNDMKKLTEIYNRQKKGGILTKQELTFLYEIDNEIACFGWKKDPRIKELLASRDKNSDVKCICEDAKIITNEKIIYLLSYLTDAKGLENLKEIRGNADFSSLESAKGLKKLQKIRGNADFRNLSSAEGLESLNEIGKDANFDFLKSAKGLESLNEIGGNANFSSLESAEGLESLNEIGGNADFSILESTKGLKKLQKIRGNADFRNLSSAEGLESLNEIGKDANFHFLESAEGLENLEKVGGDVNFWHLESAKGLESLNEIGGNANFSSLESAKGLKKLQKIRGNADFRNLSSAEGLENLKKVGGDALFNNLESAKGLENLEKIGSDAVFKNLLSTENLESLETIGRNAYFPKISNDKFFNRKIAIDGYVIGVTPKKENITNTTQQKKINEEKSKLNRAKQILISNYKKQGLTEEQIEAELNKLPKHLR